ncbi:MAG: hypothetical protein JO182_19935 [Acidobacteriaceae bacterium]|nr:hypothetical protein [Acidobacteriaceae bacterium]
MDESVGEKERMFFRYAHNRRNQVDSGSTGFTGPGRDAQDPLVRINDNAVADFLTVISPNTLLDLRLGFARFIQAAYRTTVNGFDDTALGFSQNFSANQRFNPLPPRIADNGSSDGSNYSGIYPLFGSRNPNSNITNLLSFEPNVSYVHGRQSLRFGTDLRDIRTNVSGGSFLWGSGYFNFTQGFTQFDPEHPSSNSGSSMASLLLGAPASGTLQYVPQLAFRWGYYGFYVQDDIKLTQRLTVNVGVRYDIEGSPDERYNRQNRGWNFTQPNSLANLVRNANPADCPACANLTGGLLFAGANGQPRGAYNTRYGNIQPRIGAAFSLTPLTVVRGGFGIFYLPTAEYGGALGFAANTPYVATRTGGGLNNFIPSTNFATGDPFPAGSGLANGLVLPTGASLGYNTALGNSITIANPNHDIPHVYQYSFGIERQLPFDTKLDVEYVGSRSYHLNTGENQLGGARDINANSAAQYALAQQNPAYFNASVPNPFAGLLPGNPALNGATISRQQLLKPFPQFTSVSYAFESVGKLWYDSLQVSATKRYSAHLVLALAYTFSKNLDGTTFINPQDPRPTKQLASSDRPHRIVLSGVYQLPFGKGRKFLGGVSRGWEQLVGGWEYNFIGTLQSGTPLSYPGNLNLIADPQVSNQSNSLYFNDCVLQQNGTSTAPNDTRKAFVPCTNPAWQVPATNSLRSIPTYSSVLRNPYRAQWDMSLNKNFNFSERISAQFRLEAFNVFNTPILGAPNTTYNDLNFGFITPNQSNFPRNVQLGFKFNF